MAEVTLYNADCLEVLKTLPDESIDLILCDLPYCVLKLPRRELTTLKNSVIIYLSKERGYAYERAYY